MRDFNIFYWQKSSGLYQMYPCNLHECTHFVAKTNLKEKIDWKNQIE